MVIRQETARQAQSPCGQRSERSEAKLVQLTKVTRVEIYDLVADSDRDEEKNEFRSPIGDVLELVAGLFLVMAMEALQGGVELATHFARGVETPEKFRDVELW